MLSKDQILRLAELQEYRRLAQRIVSNGRAAGPEAEGVLLSPVVAQPVALGLGLQRLCELSYAPPPEAIPLVAELLHAQSGDGLFGRGERSLRLAATAVATAGLLMWVKLAAHASGGGPTDHMRSLRIAIDRALTAMRRIHRAHGVQDDSTTAWQIVLWQLGPFEAAATALPMRAIRNDLASHGLEAETSTLSRLAVLMAA